MRDRIRPGALTGAGTSTSTISPSGSSYLQTIWSNSNQFGSGQAWLTHTHGGANVSHFSFVSVGGETLAETIAPHQVKLVTGAGSIVIEKLANAQVIEHIFVRPGACASEPDNISAVTGLTASFKLDADGALVDSSQRGEFASARKAFACRTASVTNGLRAFTSTAGLPTSSSVPSIPGQVHTDISGGCAWAAAKFAAAAAALAIAMGGEVPSGGLDTPAVLAAWGAYVMASVDYEHECANTI